MKLKQFAVDDSPHNSDGLMLHGWDEDQPVTGFISRRVMDDWVDPRQPYGRRKASIGSSTTRSASATSRRSRESLQPNIYGAGRSIAYTRLWTFCYPTSQKAGKFWMLVGLRLCQVSNGQEGAPEKSIAKSLLSSGLNREARKFQERPLGGVRCRAKPAKRNALPRTRAPAENLDLAVRRAVRIPRK